MQTNSAIHVYGYRHAPLFQEWMGMMERIKVIDIGASPIDGAPHYAAWLKQNQAELVGFDPNPESLATLNAQAGAGETYLPYAIGDGTTRTLYHTFAPGMSSLYKPNAAVMNMFFRFGLWSNVQSTSSITTTKLDDVPEARGVHFLKLDIQGAELMALQHASACLESTLVIESEVEFLPLYEDQPLFSEVEQYLRARGFQFHRFCSIMPQNIVSRMMLPLYNQQDAFAGMSQGIWSDAIFIRDLTRLDLLSDDQLLKMAIILHDCFRSFDVVGHLLQTLDSRNNTTHTQRYLQQLQAWLQSPAGQPQLGS